MNEIGLNQKVINYDPADMEGRLAEALNDVERIGMTHEDVRIAVSLFDAVNRSRALLKAYQEQRRALERIVARTTPHLGDTLEDTVKDALKANAIARAALNQKGKSHD